ncbi:MAG: bifunctional pyr operon transcriptional regulator/uracil phosphoribosyltransferase PyrR [Thermoleophilaceae bacterium]|nr:bifunctional pyr operon transcriptional regulator/uracil phosphoribosyltransferase PyrR [Thermoleophilaceae bacterium]
MTPADGEKVVLQHDDLRRTMVRIAHEIVERNGDQPFALVGIHRRGVPVANRLAKLIAEFTDRPVPVGEIDVSFHRDDITSREPQVQPDVLASRIEFELDKHVVVLVDDVLFTGRTVRAAIDALFHFGRPPAVQLAVLADRGHRELPIRPDFVGKNLPTAANERVNVRLEETDGSDEIVIAAVTSSAGAGA